MATKKQLNVYDIIAFIEDKESIDVLHTVFAHWPNKKTQVQQGGVQLTVTYLQSQRSPKILLVDISKSSLLLSDMQAIAKVCEPGTQVIAIGLRNEVSTFRSLIKLGVADYLVKPLTPNLVLQSIDGLTLKDSTVSSGESFTLYGKSIAFIGVKGGVGVSTIAANCAWLLANKELRQVGLIDLDERFGSLSQFFDIPYSSTLANICEDPTRLDESFLEKSFIKQSNQLSILSSIENINYKHKIPLEGIRKFIEINKQRYHYSIYDLPFTSSEFLSSMFFTEADIIVVIADLTALTVRDTSRILEFINKDKC